MRQRKARRPTAETGNRNRATSPRSVYVHRMSEIVHIVKLKLGVPSKTARRTVAARTNACNTVSRVGVGNGGISNAVRLYDLAYDATKARGLSPRVGRSCIPHVGPKYVAVRSNGVRPARPCLFQDQAGILLRQESERDRLPSCGCETRSGDDGLNPGEGEGKPPAGRAS
jgi:hypothetical protein